MRVCNGWGGVVRRHRSVRVKGIMCLVAYDLGVDGVSIMLVWAEE